MKYVSINYDIYDSVLFFYLFVLFDVVGLIYFYFGLEYSSVFNGYFVELFKLGGFVILECFSKKYLVYNS